MTYVFCEPFLQLRRHDYLADLFFQLSEFIDLFLQLIEDVLEREIRPALRKDGGDIELIDVDGDFVMVSLRGACVSCAASQTTLKEYVEKKLREQVLDTLIVEEVKK